LLRSGKRGRKRSGMGRPFGSKGKKPRKDRKYSTPEELKDAQKERKLRFMTNHPDYEKNYNLSKRLEVLGLLGGKCVKCGFCDYRALQIDHINGGGHAHRMKFNNNPLRYLKDIKENLHLYQLLCANCNWIKRYENDEHRSKNNS
jgi:hypothetical protein